MLNPGISNTFFYSGSYGTAVGTGVVGSCPSTFGGGYGGGVRARRAPFEIAIGECLTDNDCAGKLICCPFDGFSRCTVPQYWNLQKYLLFWIIICELIRVFSWKIKKSKILFYVILLSIYTEIELIIGLSLNNLVICIILVAQFVVFFIAISRFGDFCEIWLLWVTKILFLGYVF